MIYKMLKSVVLSSGAIQREFEIAHAERILKMRNSGWILPSDSPFKFENNVIKPKRSKGADSKEREINSPKQSKTSSRKSTAPHRDTK